MGKYGWKKSSQSFGMLIQASLSTSLATVPYRHVFIQINDVLLISTLRGWGKKAHQSLGRHQRTTTKERLSFILYDISYDMTYFSYKTKLLFSFFCFSLWPLLTGISYLGNEHVLEILTDEQSEINLNKPVTKCRLNWMVTLFMSTWHDFKNLNVKIQWLIYYYELFPYGVGERVENIFLTFHEWKG